MMNFDHSGSDIPTDKRRLRSRIRAAKWREARKYQEQTLNSRCLSQPYALLSTVVGTGFPTTSTNNVATSNQSVYVPPFKRAHYASTVLSHVTSNVQSATSNQSAAAPNVTSHPIQCADQHSTGTASEVLAEKLSQNVAASQAHDVEAPLTDQRQPRLVLPLNINSLSSQPTHSSLVHAIAYLVILRVIQSIPLSLLLIAGLVSAMISSKTETLRWLKHRVVNMIVHRLDRLSTYLKALEDYTLANSSVDGGTIEPTPCHSIDPTLGKSQAFSPDLCVDQVINRIDHLKPPLSIDNQICFDDIYA